LDQIDAGGSRKGLAFVMHWRSFAGKRGRIHHQASRDGYIDQGRRRGSVAAQNSRTICGAHKLRLLFPRASLPRGVTIEAQRRHILWLIENSPGSKRAVCPRRRSTRRVTHWRPGGFEQASVLWMEQGRQHLRM
jgi:hypothetical protein